MSKSPTVPVTVDDLSSLLQELESAYTLAEVSFRRRRYGGPDKVLVMEVVCLDTKRGGNKPRIVLDAVLPVGQPADLDLVAFRLLWAALDRAILLGCVEGNGPD